MVQEFLILSLQGKKSLMRKLTSSKQTSSASLVRQLAGPWVCGPRCQKELGMSHFTQSVLDVGASYLGVLLACPGVV